MQMVDNKAESSLAQCNNTLFNMYISQLHINIEH